jgi:hypothetical protein
MKVPWPRPLFKPIELLSATVNERMVLVGSKINSSGFSRTRPKRSEAPFPRSRRRTRPDRAVPDPCASRGGGRPEALPERTAWWSTCRGADSNTRRIAAPTGDRPITDPYAGIRLPRGRGTRLRAPTCGDEWASRSREE